MSDFKERVLNDLSYLGLKLNIFLEYLDKEEDYFNSLLLVLQKDTSSRFNSSLQKFILYAKNFGTQYEDFNSIFIEIYVSLALWYSSDVKALSNVRTLEELYRVNEIVNFPEDIEQALLMYSWATLECYESGNEGRYIGYLLALYNSKYSECSTEFKRWSLGEIYDSIVR